MCIFLREPADRILSTHRYNLGSSSRYAKYASKLLTPIRYASLPKQSRFYEIYTSGLPMEKFAFVGITEEYEASIDLFKAIFGISLPKYNVNVNGKVPDDFSVREMRAIKARQRANYAIYDEARRRFDALYSQYVR